MKKKLAKPAKKQTAKELLKLKTAIRIGGINHEGVHKEPPTG